MSDPIVKKWETLAITSLWAPGRWYPVRHASGGWNWESVEHPGTLWHPINSVAASLYPVMARKTAATPPTYDVSMPSSVPADNVPVHTQDSSVEACSYVSGKVIPGIETIPYLTLSRYRAPIRVKEEEASRFVISSAKRRLREIPLCSMTGQPVEIVAAITKDAIEAQFLCPTCSEKKR